MAEPTEHQTKLSPSETRASPEEVFDDHSSYDMDFDSPSLVPYPASSDDDTPASIPPPLSPESTPGTPVHADMPFRSSVCTTECCPVTDLSRSVGDVSASAPGDTSSGDTARGDAVLESEDDVLTEDEPTEMYIISVDGVPTCAYTTEKEAGQAMWSKARELSFNRFRSGFRVNSTIHASNEVRIVGCRAMFICARDTLLLRPVR